MKITITNNGVAGVDAITIFTMPPNANNITCVEGGQSYDLEWDPASGIRYELVPWEKVPTTK